MSASPNQIYDPLTGNADGTGRTPFANKQVPVARFDPAVQKLIQQVGLPNLNNDLTNNFYGAGAYRVTRHKFDSKVNWRASSKLNVSGRLGKVNYDMQNPTVFGDVGVGVDSAAGVHRQQTQTRPVG